MPVMQVLNTRAVHAGRAANVRNRRSRITIGLESAGERVDDPARALDNAAFVLAERDAAAPAGDRP